MDIRRIKDLCSEHDRLEEVVGIIEQAMDYDYCVKIKSPRNEAYMSNIQVNSVLHLAKNRIVEIEEELKR